MHWQVIITLYKASRQDRRTSVELLLQHPGLNLETGVPLTKKIQLMALAEKQNFQLFQLGAQAKSPSSFAS